MRMKALKTFRVGDTDLVARPGMEFDTSAAKARHFEAHGMAVPVHAVPKLDNPVAEQMKAHFQAETGKLSAEAREPARPSQAGGPIGEATPSSSSDPAPAPPKRRSSRRAAKRE